MRDAFAKGIYGRLFVYIVKKINMAIHRNSPSSSVSNQTNHLNGDAGAGNSGVNGSAAEGLDFNATFSVSFLQSITIKGFIAYEWVLKTQTLLTSRFMRVN